jgi:uncharacterized membrane protein
LEPFKLSLQVVYAFSLKAVWFWTTIFLAVAAAISILVIPEAAGPIVYLRTALGFVFIVFLPGFALTKALFPDAMPIKTSSEGLEVLERVALGFGLSLILSPMAGLILNYTFWGVSLVPVTVVLLVVCVGLALVGMFRESKSNATLVNL